MPAVEKHRGPSGNSPKGLLYLRQRGPKGIQKGASVSYNDPYIPEFSGLRSYDFSMKSKKLTGKLLQSQDAVIIATDHDAYNYPFIVRNSKLVIDTRNATKNVKKHRERIVRA